VFLQTKLTARCNRSSGLSDAPSSEEDSSESENDEPMDIASSSDEEDGVQDLYPLEGKYKDHADMQKLLAMSEIDREAVLAERAAQIERAQQDRHLRSLLKSRSATGGANGASASGTSARRSTRTKSMPKKTEETTKRGKLDELKKVREERSARAAGSGKPVGDDEDTKARRRSIFDDDDEKTGFAEDIYTKEDERDITLADVNRARIGRTGLGKLCDYPNFEETVTGNCRSTCWANVGFANDWK
jgi:RNA polymerase-associated protein RTF1